MTMFRNIHEFIKCVKKNEHLIGILQYGSNSIYNIREGDLDITLVYDYRPSDVINGIHLYVGELPVDVMIVSIDDFYLDIPRDEFQLAHINAEIIFDTNEILSKAMSNIKKNWTLDREFNSLDISKLRFCISHRLNKVHNRFDDIVYCNLAMGELIEYSLFCYGKINNLEVGKDKHFLNHMSVNNSKLYELLEKYYSENDVYTKYTVLLEYSGLFLKSYGGLWRKDEIIFHDYKTTSNNEERRKLLDFLGVEYESIS